MYRGEVKDLREMVAFLNCELEKTKLPMNAAVVKLDADTISKIKAGLFIQAVKEYRIASNSSLKEAVDHCRELRVNIIRGLYGPFDMSAIDPTGYIRREYMGMKV